jgi:hypothetical protein
MSCSLVTAHRQATSFFFLDPNFYSIPNTTIGASVQGLFHLSISALIIATSPRESMTGPRFFAVIFTVLTAGGLYPTDSLDNGGIVTARMVSKTEQ